MNLCKADITIITKIILSITIMITLFFLVIMLTGCETVRGMGKDTKNITNKTTNTVGNVFGGKQKQ